MKKTPLEQLESWITEFYKINGTPTLDEIKGQIELLKDYEKEQLALFEVVQAKPENCDHEWRVYSFDHFGFPLEQYCENCDEREAI